MHKRESSWTATHYGRYAVLGDNGVTLEPLGRDANRLEDGYADAHDGPLRITAPAVRRGWLEAVRRGEVPSGSGRGADGYVTVDWDTALDLVASELARVRKSSGDNAVYGGSYGWASAGRFHHAQSQIHRFLRLGGGYTDSVNSYSAGAMEVILPHVIGGSSWAFSERGVTWPQIEQAGQLVVSFGGMAPKNAFANAGGIGEHVQPSWQKRCRDAGVEFVNVSPQRTDIAESLGGEWVSLRPATDLALMLALTHELVLQGLADLDFLHRCCTGWPVFWRYLEGSADGQVKSAEWAASICDVPAAAIRRLARSIGTRRTTINVSWSLQRQRFGEQTHWMGVVLASASGSMGRLGGGYAGGLGISQIGVRSRRPRVASLPQGRNEVAQRIPVARVADMLLNPGAEFDYNGTRQCYPDIRLVYWIGGNPFHHHQDLHRLVRAWRQPETVITHESWWTPLPRFSDVVFPVATSLERNDIAIGQLDLTLAAMHRVRDTPPGVGTDFDVFAALAHRLGYGDRFTEGRSADDWVRELYARTKEELTREGVSLPDFADFWRAGSVDLPEPGEVTDWSFSRLRADPERFPVPTPSGKIEVFSETIAGFGYDDCPGHPVWLEPEEWAGCARAAEFPLHLLSNQPKTRLHSQLDHARHSQQSKVAGREPVLINTRDAQERDISSGQVVRIFNDRGACLAGAVLTDDIRPGVVVLATGAWFDPEQPGVSGTLCRHGNPNVLTMDTGTSRLAQGPSPGNTLVELEAYAGTPPPVKIFDPPLLEPDSG